MGRRWLPTWLPRELKSSARSFPDGDENALAGQLNLACDLTALRKPDQALEVVTEVGPAYEQTLGVDLPFTLAGLSNMISYLRAIASTNEATRLADAAPHALKRKPGEDPPFTVAFTVNRANCLHDLQHLASAETERADWTDLRELCALLYPALGRRMLDAQGERRIG